MACNVESYAAACRQQGVSWSRICIPAPHHDLTELVLLLRLLGPTLKVRNEKARRFLASMRKKPGVDLAAYFPRADPGALALLRRLLAFDPADRPSAEEALADPFFHNLHSPAREPSAQVGLSSSSMHSKSQCCCVVCSVSFSKASTWVSTQDAYALACGPNSWLASLYRVAGNVGSGVLLSMCLVTAF